MNEQHSDTFENTLLTEAEFVVVDVETTGMSAADDRMTEIAMIRVRGEEIVDEFSTLINPLITIPAFITDLTGIDNLMVRDAPTAREVVPYIIEFLGSAVFVAHNAPFDWGFVFHTVRRECGAELSSPQLCTVRLSRRILPSLPSKSLGPVAKHLEIDIHQRHRASGDAYATAQVLLRYLAYIRSKYAFKTLGELLRFQSAAKATV